MPVPDREAWQARWRSAGRDRFGVSAADVGEDFASFIVDLAYGDERDDDPLFASAALTYASDIAALAAVSARIDEEREQRNGTMSLHLNFVTPPSGKVTIEGRVSAWGTHDALIDLTGRDEAARLVLRGLVAYSLRPRNAEAEA